MPPWRAEHTDPPFVGEERLTEIEIATIRDWVVDGMPKGDATDPPVDAMPAGSWQSGTPDLVLTAPTAYEMKPDGPDVFHLFIIPVPVDRTRYVRGLEFDTTSRAVHHANLLVDRTHRSREFSGRDESAESAGFIPRSAQYPEGQILGWVPGRADPLLPPELSWRLEPGSDLVVQLHLQPTGKRERVQPRIALYFSETPPTRTPALLRLGRQDLDIPAGDRHYTTVDSFALPVEAAVLALKPHAHYRAKSVRVRALLPDGTVRDLLAIADWDMRWQQVYRYVSPIALPKGTVLTSEFAYDNSADNPRNPVIPPTAVSWGPWSTDEMGDCWIQLLADSPGDLSLLARDAGRKMATMDLVGYERMIARDPRNVGLRDDAGFLSLQLDRPADAASQFRAAVGIAGDSAGEHFNLGLALAMASHIDEAIREYRRSIQLDATSAAVHDSLGTALASIGDTERARFEYESAIRLDAQNARARNNFGNLLMGTGQFDVALEHFRAAIALDASLPDPHYNAALALEHKGELVAALGEFRQASRLAPATAAPLAGIAWILATAADAQLRDPSEAMRVADRLTTLLGETPGTLDLRAAAYAAAGRFSDAASMVHRALALSSAGTPDSAMVDRERRYTLGESYYERSGMPPHVR